MTLPLAVVAAAAAGVAGKMAYTNPRIYNASILDDTSTSSGATTGDNPEGIASISPKWLLGYLGTWFVLSALADNDKTQGMASVLAWTVAATATVALLPKVKSHLGL